MKGKKKNKIKHGKKIRFKLSENTIYSFHTMNPANPSHSTPLISVVIPVHNGELYIEKCLLALSLSSYNNFEIILVDDGSCDLTVEKSKLLTNRLIKNQQNRGPAYSRNIGVSMAKGEIILFIDSDVLVKPKTIELVANHFVNNPQLAAIFGSYDDSPESTDFISQYRNLFHHYHHQNGQQDSSTFWAGCGAIQKKIFYKVGGFDENKYQKPSIEDIELGYRLKQKGFSILLDKELLVTHLKRWSFLTMIRTDVLQRAIPWSSLILKTRFMPNDLNLNTYQKISSLLIGLIILTTPLLFSAYFQLVSAIYILLFSIIFILNRQLYFFYARKRGFIFMLKVLPLHFLYYTYSGFSFLYCWIQNKLVNKT